MEFISFVTYKYPRNVTRPLIDGTAITQRMGHIEIIEWRAEWVKAERIRDLVKENFPQESDEDFVVNGEPSIQVVSGLDGHNLFNVSLKATRYVSIEGVSSSTLFSRSVQ